MTTRARTLCLLFSALFCAGTAKSASALAPESVEFFEKRIRPVLAEQCYKCHSEAEKIKGGLALDTREATLLGGDSGPSLVPGDPDKSKLIEAVRYKNRDLQMPPKNALTEQQIRDLETWVKMGAPDPRDAKPVAATAKVGINIEEGRKFWSFQPLSSPELPTVGNTAWVKSPVDTFVLEALEKAALHPAPPADKRTLIRRATFDLTGLPPTPAEVEAFLADGSTAAFPRVVERLLASPQYGERWGRHWLDVARYADSNGIDENVAYGHAWRYRDYVVRAFNDDKPYDQFLVEQLAGDLLPAAAEEQRIEQLTATGFLSLGARVLAEPDVRKMEMDIIDEQLDTLGKAFMGMTLGCCRCHDHKFDPIPTADYYALAAIFRSTKSLSDEKMGAIKFWYEHPLATPEQMAAKKEHEAQVTAQRAKVTKFAADLRAKLKAELQERAADYLAASVELPEDASFKEVEKVAAQHRLRARNLLTCRLYLARNADHPVFSPWHRLAQTRDAEGIRTHYKKVFADTAAALKEAVAAAAQAAQAKLVKDKPAPEKAPVVKPSDPVLAAAFDALNDVAGFLTIPDKQADAFDDDMLNPVKAMNDDLMALEDRTPEPPAIMSVRDDAIVRTLPVHIRGSYLTLGEEVQRGFPEVMRVSLSQPVLPAKQSGRLQLARWMASSEHPLTARVAVNRLWRWHFGAGIVASTDNFGILGDKPSHPALLDWLARRFIEEGWSIKEMHRLMMNSSTYQMASVHPAADQPSSSPDPAMVDPENKLLWRANIQRLEAEQIRDAMLAASESLSREIGGKTIPLRNREFVFNHTSKDATRYETPRRALYLPIIRNHLYDMLEQFDYPDPTMPTGSRNSTIVAPQALIMLNAPVVRQAAERLAAKILREGKTEESALQLAYASLYSRPPGEQETRRALSFLDSQTDRKEAWAVLCHTLLAANEFIYLR